MDHVKVQSKACNVTMALLFYLFSILPYFKLNDEILFNIVYPCARNLKLQAPLFQVKTNLICKNIYS